MNLQSKIRKWKLSQYLINKNYRFNRKIILKNFPNNIVDKAYNSISKWKGYSQTPLIRLNKLSKEDKVFSIGIEIFLKTGLCEKNQSLAYFSIHSASGK